MGNSKSIVHVFDDYDKRPWNSHSSICNQVNNYSSLNYIEGWQFWKTLRNNPTPSWHKDYYFCHACALIVIMHNESEW